MVAAKRNNSVDIIRYACALLVVAIHTNPFQESCFAAYYLITQFIARVGVPFYFAVSGYFFFQKLEKNTLKLGAQLCALLKKYVLWSVVYFAIVFLEGGYAEPFRFIEQCVLNFAVYGSYYQFWFFPALVYAMCFSYFIYKAGLKKLLIPLSLLLYVVGCLGCSYYGLGIQLPLLGQLYSSEHFKVIRRVILTGIPYFVSGRVVGLVFDRYFISLHKKKILQAWIVTAILWIGEFILIHVTKWNDHTVITFSMYLMVTLMLMTALRYPMPESGPAAERCRVLAGFTYCAHPLAILLLDDFFDDLIGVTISGFPLYLLTVLLTFCVGILIYRSNNKYLNCFAL